MRLTKESFVFRWSMYLLTFYEKYEMTTSVQNIAVVSVIQFIVLQGSICIINHLGIRDYLPLINVYPTVRHGQISCSYDDFLNWCLF